VPPHLVFDVDPYNIEGGTEDPFRAWKKVQDRTPDVYFSPHYGGFWILNRAALIAEVVSDPQRFSHSPLG
jgi:cytochrome P450